MQKEITTLAPSAMKIKINALPEHKYGVDKQLHPGLIVPLVADVDEQAGVG